MGTSRLWIIIGIVLLLVVGAYFYLSGNEPAAPPPAPAPAADAPATPAPAPAAPSTGGTAGN